MSKTLDIFLYTLLCIYIVSCIWAVKILFTKENEKEHLEYLYPGGTCNVCVGQNAGKYITTEHHNIIIGDDSQSNGHSHTILFGNGLIADKDYQIKIGRNTLSSVITEKEWIIVDKMIRRCLNQANLTDIKVK